MGDTLHPEFASDVRYPDHRWVTEKRIPLVCTQHPRWKYEVALLVPGNPEGVEVPASDLYGAVWPTEEEAALVALAIEYRREWYNEGWRAKMLERPLDVDSGTNTVVLCKRADGWFYTKATFSPAIFYPGYGKPNPHTPDVAGLRSLLDLIFGGLTPRWDEFKARHPDEWESV